MKSLVTSNILISGMNGTGLELAKCVILGGIKNVMIHDNKKVKLVDLSTNYYLTENDIGNNRIICCEKLKELNPYVQVNTCDGDLLDCLQKTKYDVIILNDNTFEEHLYVDTNYRNKSKIIITYTCGSFGNIFCDFGDEFHIKDLDGEEIKTGIIIDMTINDFKKMSIIMTTGEHHGLTYNDLILIDKLDKKFKVTKIIDVNTCEISYYDNNNNNNNNDDKMNDDKIIINKMIEKLKNENFVNVNFTQIKETSVMKFKNLQESIENPEIVITDYSYYDRSNHIHNVYKCLYTYEKKYNKMPDLWSEDDSNKLIEVVNKINLQEIPIEIIKKIAYTHNGSICALNGIIGSIAAQEVIKACSNKFTPLNQWLYYDIIDLISDCEPKIDKSIETRYDSQRYIFGDELQKKINESKIFVVGSGAIGCEHLKNLAMIGIKEIIVTDMDTIEKSNLNRQFLFRSDDIGKFKSEIAAKAIKKINPNINVIAQQNRVSIETKNIYNEEFYQSLTVVMNALDNIPTRLYIDNDCVSYCVPLLESGTLGTKGNTQSIIPHITESYGSMKDAPNKEIPVCTLKSFPYLIDHTIQWSRDIFEGLFNNAPKNFKECINNFNKLKTMTATEIATIYNDIKLIVDNKPKKYSDCVKYAYKFWHEQYRNIIYEITQKFPFDHKTSDGILFWSGTKKFPTPLEFSNNELNIMFIKSFSNLWADVFNISPDERSDDIIKLQLKKLKKTSFNVSNNLQISINEEEEKKYNEEKIKNYENEKESMIKEISYYVKKYKKLDINPLEFEKDNDANFHIDFITSSANLRGSNYGIPYCDRHKVKGIAGKIIPAIATTTVLVSSISIIELYKILLGKNKREDFRNVFINLALCYITQSEPNFPPSNKLGNKIFTIWDSIKFKNPTLDEVISFFDDDHDLNITVDTVMCGSTILYSDFISSKSKLERRSKKVIDLYKEISGETNIDQTSPLNIVITTDDGQDIPVCKVYF